MLAQGVNGYLVVVSPRGSRKNNLCEPGQWLYVLLDVRMILSPMVKNGKSKKSRLRACRVVDVPLHEVSGICFRRSRTGRMSLIAVGDRASKIAWFSLPRSDKGRIDWHTSDSSKLSGSMLPEDDPQTEAVCADGLGRILLFQETPRRVEFMDPKASKMIASIELAVEGRGEIAERGPIRRGRGEKKPAALIELGPPDSRSRDLLRGDALADGERWRTKKGRRRFMALAIWVPGKTLAKTCADFSDLEIGPDGCLYLLSDKSSTIARLDDLPAGGGAAALVDGGGSATWMARRKVLHSPHRVTRSSGSTHASRAEISPARAGGC